MNSNVPGTTLSVPEIQRLVVHELGGPQCRCATTKQRGQTFCKRCYYTLPPAMRHELYNRVGNGYEAAYVAAVNFLLHAGRMQRPEWLTEAEQSDADETI